MNKINFIKMHGAGNDFIMVDSTDEEFLSLNQLAESLCDRHFGIGGDGLILILNPEDNRNDYKMRMFNSNGSEAEMCGNGIRCFAHYLKKYKNSSKNIFRVETLSGIIKPEIIEYKKKTSLVKVNMGKPHFKPDEIPIKINEKLDYIRDYKLKIMDKEFRINCVSMGNPHTIIFMDEVNNIPLKKWGEAIENHSAFPEKTNVEFIRIVGRNEIIMKVWERGSGITLACGTGASASVVAGIKNNYLDNEVLVHLPGGDLTITWNQYDDVYMTGPSEIVFHGNIYME